MTIRSGRYVASRAGGLLHECLRVHHVVGHYVRNPALPGDSHDRPALGHNPFSIRSQGFCLSIRMDKRCVSIITHSLQFRGAHC